MIRRKSGDDEQSAKRRDTDEELLSGLRAAHVFDVTQTEGKPLPEFVTVAGDPEENLTLLKELFREHNVERSYEYISRGARTTTL